MGGEKGFRHGVVMVDKITEQVFTVIDGRYERTDGTPGQFVINK